MSTTLTTLNPPARSLALRVRDTLDRLDRDVDAWFATADPAGLATLPASCPHECGAAAPRPWTPGDDGGQFHASVAARAPGRRAEHHPP
ncbi:hypothetical protein [Nonomuraea recticatena]|uniref:Uncharacterized protein n=1 Tax=Nonomuraea recticatena TaxID=46178 RepID=A0ABN3SEM4_9ACTN